ncbi:hypothetical protein C8F01DRAFT_988050 [Mycena amicta]|nr:hypothetical protein C8F01DRAFT_988050 [Mycena amicta]
MRYVCSRAGTGGEKPYAKKFPERKHKKELKVIECTVSLSIKVYANSSHILGWLHNREHNHPTGDKNLPFTRIPKALREIIAGHVRNGLSAAVILSKIQTDAYDPYSGYKTSNAVRKACTKYLSYIVSCLMPFQGPHSSQRHPRHPKVR